jgi:hypothetical protein
MLFFLTESSALFNGLIVLMFLCLEVNCDKVKTDVFSAGGAVATIMRQFAAILGA